MEMAAEEVRLGFEVGITLDVAVYRHKNINVWVSAW